MQLSDQALGAVMMALQKSLMEQSDIVPVLKGFKFQSSDTGLVVMNPPIVRFNDDFERINAVSEEATTPVTKTTKTKTKKKKTTTKTRAKKAPSRRAPSKKRAKATVKVSAPDADDS